MKITWLAVPISGLLVLCLALVLAVPAGCPIIAQPTGPSNGSADDDGTGSDTNGDATSPSDGTGDTDGDGTGDTDGDATARPSDEGAIVADHAAAAAFDSIPSSSVAAAQSTFRIYYGHTSHGGQVITGLEMLQADDNRYAFNAGA
ncbi:MAG: hypothetical protein KKI08_10755, partial [Armatimonadetes bacterium]|nr:hypothetical protein [Armatimonadota bacterium]